MTEDKKAQEAVEHADKSTEISKQPAAGPHAKDRLTDRDKTPGTGSLPDPDSKETDAGPD
ncbi:MULTISPECIES: hypothetical protein [Rhizobium/Agrobacterium group]|uniref:Uncharacterized protein n=2 Tax=Neorhizobium TaxID=1525371 RepID=A0ABV0MCX0_9HYPH|nr:MULTISPECIES: hypothetical protein [Rhizobium/Agrobacterium group]KGE00221.1 hypothetical protein JL39_11120 [Rhizobium sp. YS-1r]MCC2611135.1 hypothetical protein [Neorhizobium petrolearium]WGI66347.1 hypothetical protein QEO92_14975 [Neorhizobium petrolearium]